LNIKFTTKPYLPTLVVSIILFIMVFLPWVSVSGFGISVSANGTGDWGVLTLIMSIVGAGVSFLATQKYRALGTIGAGILALIGVAIYWARIGSGVSVGVGLIIALIAALGLLAVGYMDYRKITPPAKPSQPPQPPPANPPAPPPEPPKQ